MENWVVGSSKTKLINATFSSIWQNLLLVSCAEFNTTHSVYMYVWTNFENELVNLIMNLLINSGALLSLIKHSFCT